MAHPTDFDKNAVWDFSQAALDALSAHIAMLNGRGEIVAVNKPWCRFADANAPVPEAYGLGINYLDLCGQVQGPDQEYAQATAHGIQKVINGEIEEFNLVYPCHSPAEKRWFNLRVTRFEDGSHVIAAHENITQQVLAELEREQTYRQLRERVKELTTLYRTSQILQDEDASVPNVLERVVRILPNGWRYAENVAARIAADGMEFTTPDFAATPWRQRAEFTTSSGRPGVVEVVYLEEQSPEAEGVFLAEERHLIDAIAGLIQQFLERRSDREECARLLRERSELARQWLLILDSAGEGIYGIDTQENCSFVNKAAAEMLGYDPAELIGKNMHALIHHTRPEGTPYPQAACPLNLTIRFGEPCRIDHEVFWHRDGTSFPVQYSSNPIREGQTIHGAVVTFFDITERKRVEATLRAQLEELQRWYNLTLDNEQRVIELKREVNQLLKTLGEAPRYLSVE